jgi:hypothetical protein
VRNGHVAPELAVTFTGIRTTGKQTKQAPRRQKNNNQHPHPSKIAKKYWIYLRPIKRENGVRSRENLQFNRATTERSPPPSCGTSHPAMSAFQHAATILSFSIDCALWVSNNSLN